MTTIQINHKKNIIEMTKKFYNAACQFGTDEYKMLQEARRDYPGYKPVVAKTKKSGTGAQDVFKGLTYEYMEIYIEKHDDENKSIMAEFKIQRRLGHKSEITTRRVYVHPTEAMRLASVKIINEMYKK